jgi:hypothetical protein
METTHPADARAEVQDAVHKTYVNRLWLVGGQPNRLDDGRLTDLSHQQFRAMVPDAAVAVVKRKKNEVVEAIPRTVIDDCYYAQDFARSLRAVRRNAWVDASGELVNAEGLHGDLWLHWPGDKADPDDVSDRDVSDVMERLLGDFRFVSDGDRLVFVAMLLQTVRSFAGHASPLGVISAEIPSAARRDRPAAFPPAGRRCAGVRSLRPP